MNSATSNAEHRVSRVSDNPTECRALADECGIHWDVDINRPEYRYVRVRIDEFASFRARKWKWYGPGVRVGFAVLNAKALPTRPGYFTRRAFWIDPHDPYLVGTPSDGVDPLTVRPGVAGEITPRARGEAA